MSWCAGSWIIHFLHLEHGVVHTPSIVYSMTLSLMNIYVCSGSNHTLGDSWTYIAYFSKRHNCLLPHFWTPRHHLICGVGVESQCVCHVVCVPMPKGCVNGWCVAVSTHWLLVSLWAGPEHTRGAQPAAAVAAAVPDSYADVHSDHWLEKKLETRSNCAV